VGIMKTSDFDYNLPEELIAQTPLKDRASSKLLVMDRFTGELEHKEFRDIKDYLHKGDVLVINDTKVIPARLIGSKEDTKAVIEILLLKELGDDNWECLARPGKRLKEGTIVSFGDGMLKAEVTKN
jgi:S-adenosylmethionine:tRNA ribosyltransferase-isomerase